MGKQVVITGATSGIGREVAIELAQQGCKLAVIGRSEEKGKLLESALRSKVPNCKFGYYLADMSSIDSVKRASEAVVRDCPVIDVLINNAGGVFSEFELTEDGIERTIANNHLGYYVSTLKMLDRIRASSDGRIIIVASASHYRANIDFDSFTSKGSGYFIMKSYGQSKLANILFTYELADRLEGSGIAVNVLHPGVVKTGIGGKAEKKLHKIMWNVFSKLGGITTEKSARTYVKLAMDEASSDYHGLYFHAGEIKKSSALSYDVPLRKKLWDWSAKVTGLDLDAD